MDLFFPLPVVPGATPKKTKKPRFRWENAANARLLSQIIQNGTFAKATIHGQGESVLGSNHA